MSERMESLREWAEKNRPERTQNMARQVGVSQKQAEQMSGTPTGTYTLELRSVSEPMENKFNPKIPRCRFTFEVLDFEPEEFPQEEDYDDPKEYEKELAWAQRDAEAVIGREIRFTYSMSLGTQGYLWPVYKALLGRTPAEDHIPDADLIEGKKITATVELVKPPSGGDPRPQIIAAKAVRTGPRKPPRLEVAGDDEGGNEAEADSVDEVPF